MKIYILQVSIIFKIRLLTLTMVSKCCCNISFNQSVLQTANSEATLFTEVIPTHKVVIVVHAPEPCI